MTDRGFSEVELRRMLSIATGFRRDIVPGRWLIETRHRRAAWEVSVEPEPDSHILVIVTAYPIDP